MTQQTEVDVKQPTLVESDATGESLKTLLMRWGFNWFPAYRRTGAQVTYIAADLHEVRIKLPLNWKTRNYVGTLFGGSMFGAVDGIHLVMLIKLLGSDYHIWDKASTIRFKQPGRTTLYARFILGTAELETIRTTLAAQPKLDRIYRVDLTDAAGVMHASFEKTIHIRRKEREQADPGCVKIRRIQDDSGSSYSLQAN